MKNSWEWNEEDLLNLVKTQTKESISLDFKRSASLQNTDPKKNEISKDVSALANAAGGTLLYGMEEDGFVAKRVDDGVDPKVITKEWLEQVINSRIQRKIEGVRINQIDLKITHKGNVAYAVYVPPSNRAPHQAYDKKFYKRYNFESVPMEEYEIRDVSRRDEVPDLNINFILPSSPFPLHQDGEKPANIPIYSTISNQAIEPANYAVIVLYIDARLDVANAAGLDLQSELFLSAGEKQHKVHLLRMNWSIPGKLPIFNDLEIKLTSDPIVIKVSNELLKKDGTYILGYEVKSPKMTPRQEFRLLEIKDRKATLSEKRFTPNEFVSGYDSLNLSSS